MLLTDLVHRPNPESVTVAVLQWLNLHLQVLGEDEGDEEDNDVYEDNEKMRIMRKLRKPFYLPAGLPQLGASRCPESGPVPRSGIWSAVFIVLC